MSFVIWVDFVGMCFPDAHSSPLLRTVEEGGGTDFPNLKLTVMPKRGRALIWPSVLDEKPDEKDGRTMHQALPVTKGVKYGANAWVHQRDFKGPAKRGCT